MAMETIESIHRRETDVFLSAGKVSREGVLRDVRACRGEVSEQERDRALLAMRCGAMRYDVVRGDAMRCHRWLTTRLA